MGTQEEEDLAQESEKDLGHFARYEGEINMYINR